MSFRSLPIASAQLVTMPTALIEAALASELSLSVWQPGWRWDAAYLDDDVSTFVWADDKILGLKEPPQLRPGLVALLPEHLDQLRNGRVYVREIEDHTGLRVRLLEPRWITWAGVLIDQEEWQRFRSSAAATQLPQVTTSGASTTSGTSSTDVSRAVVLPPTVEHGRHELATAPFARLVGRRKVDVAALADEAVAAGVALQRGEGQQRRHVRWLCPDAVRWLTTRLGG